MSRRDIVWWVNNFVWTYDPRAEENAYMPMDLFPIQEELIHWIDKCIEDKVHGVVEKSRDAGVTWIFCVVFCHKWLFQPGFAAGIGSRKEDLVDKKDDPDSIFEKLRQLLKKLPKWMMPAGWNPKRHIKDMMIVNPVNDNTITGEAGDNIGRGGRKSVYLVDESAFTANPKSINSALSQTTNVQFDVSTPNGNGNPFAQKVRQAKKNLALYGPNGGNLRFFSMHWKRDPRKNYWVLRNPDGTIMAEGHGPDAPKAAQYPWYEKQKETINDAVIIAQELDIDYSASIEGICIPAKYVTAAVDFDKWLETQNRLPQDDPLDQPVAGYDVADEGDAVNVMAIIKNWRVVELQSWGHLDVIKSAERSVKIANSRRVSLVNYDSSGIGNTIGASYRSGMLNPKFLYQGINGGSKCTGGKWPVGIDDRGKVRFKTSKEKFQNLRAESWWTVRERFRKTYEYRELGVHYPISELISIPEHQELIEQLSSVLCETTDLGKIKLESKLDMRERGISSPDYADAVVLAFCPKKWKPAPPPYTGSQRSY